MLLNSPEEVFELDFLEKIPLVGTEKQGRLEHLSEGGWSVQLTYGQLFTNKHARVTLLLLFTKLSKDVYTL